MNNRNKKISSDKIVSYSAIIIAMASIFVANWQGIETRNHNRLSVRPKLEIIFESGKDSFGYYLLNNGLGPAIVTEKTILKFNLTELYTGDGGFYGGLTIDDVYLKNLDGVVPDIAGETLVYNQNTGEYTYTTGEPLIPGNNYELQIGIKNFNPYASDETQTFTFEQPNYG